MVETEAMTNQPANSEQAVFDAAGSTAAQTGNLAQASQFELQLLKQAIERTEAIVRDETAALRRGGGVDLHEFSSRKSHQLLALKRAFDATANVSGRESMTKEMDQLRDALAENTALLRTRLAAVQEIADIISSVMRQAESDGTYSRMVLGGGAK